MNVLADWLRRHARKVLWSLLATFALFSAAAMAQVVPPPSVGDYFNFDIKQSRSPSNVVLRGTLIVGSVGTDAQGNIVGTFSSVRESTTFYTPNGLGGTSYGISNTQAVGGSTSFGSFKQSGAGYYISGLDFGFTTSEPQYYVVSGSAQDSNSGNFSLYSTTYTTTYVTKSAAAGVKALSTGTGTEIGSFTTALAPAEAPEINGGTLPKATLLFFCILALAGSARAGRLSTSLKHLFEPLTALQKAHRPTHPA